MIGLDAVAGGGEGVQPPANEVGCCGRLCGRIFKDWTQGVIALLAAGGLSAIGLGFIADDKKVIAIGVAALALGLFFGCMRITCLKPKRETEQQLEFFQAENGRLQRQIGTLDQRIELLGARRDELRSVLTKANKSVADLEVTLRTKTEDLSAIVVKLKVTEANLAQLEELYVKFKEGTQEVARSVQEFQSAASGLRSGAALLGEEVDELDGHADGIDGQGDRFQEANRQFEEKNQMLSQLLAKMETDGDAINERFTEVKGSLALLKKGTSVLDEVDDKFRDGAQVIDGATTKLRDLVDDLQHLLDEDDGSGKEEAQPMVNASASVSRFVAHDPEDSEPEGDV